jgi:hypothetical protein
MSESSGTPQMPAAQSAGGRAHCDNGELIRMLGKGLEARGLEFRLVTYPDDDSPDSHIEQVIVTNPRIPERGEVRVSDDGTVTWEYPGRLDDVGAGRIMGEIINVLRASGLPLRRAGLILE